MKVGDKYRIFEIELGVGYSLNIASYATPNGGICKGALIIKSIKIHE